MPPRATRIRDVGVGARRPPRILGAAARPVAAGTVASARTAL